MSFLGSGEIEKNEELKKLKVETQDICVDIVYSVGIKKIYIFLVVWKFFNNFASDNKKCIILLAGVHYLIVYACIGNHLI